MSYKARKIKVKHLKKEMKTIRESINELKNASREVGGLQTALEQTSSYSEYISLNRQKFADTLFGSEHQIAWAMKLREQIAHRLAWKICVYYYHKIGYEVGVEKVNWTSGVDFTREINKALKVIKSNSAPFIIENREIDFF